MRQRLKSRAVVERLEKNYKCIVRAYIEDNTNAARKVKAVRNKAKIDKKEDTSRNVRLSTSLNIVNFRLNLSNLRTYIKTKTFKLMQVFYQI